MPTPLPSLLRRLALRSACLCMAAGLLCLGACGQNIETRGALKDADWKSKIFVGQTTQDEVRALLGTPSARSTFGPETWYYITLKRETVAFFKPEVIDEEVVQIAFAPDNTVKSVNVTGKDKARDIQISDRVTPTEGHQLSFVEQLLGNVGRFNSPTNGLPGQQGGGGVPTPTR